MFSNYIFFYSIWHAFWAYPNMQIRLLKYKSLRDEFQSLTSARQLTEKFCSVVKKRLISLPPTPNAIKTSKFRAHAWFEKFELSIFLSFYTVEGSKVQRSLYQELHRKIESDFKSV